MDIYIYGYMDIYIYMGDSQYIYIYLFIYLNPYKPTQTHRVAGM